MLLAQAGHYQNQGAGVKITTNSERLDFKFMGWIKFEDVALDTFGIFVDGIESTDEIIWNSSAQAAGYLDIWNGTGADKGVLSNGAGAGSEDIMSLPNFGPNARRFTITTFMLTNLWNEMKAEVGMHTLYVVARMADGQLIVIKGYEIEVVDHECTFPEDGTQDVGTVVAPTCTKEGYTVVNCLVDAHGCTATTNINAVEALGHESVDEWTFLDGKHFKACVRECGYRYEEGECYGADGSHCDTCGALYACNHNYIVDAEDGSVRCIGGCGAVKYAAPDYFWTGEDLVNEAFAAYTNCTPTIQEDGSALITGAATNAGENHTISLLLTGGQYIAIVYKSTAAHQIWWCTYNPAHNALDMSAASGWTVKAAQVQEHVAGRTDIRFNISASDLETEIAYIAAFNDLSAWVAYVNDATTYVLPTVVE